MEKIKIKLVTVGHVPTRLDLKKLSTWKSSVFILDEDIESFQMPHKADGYNWEFTDLLLEKRIPLPGKETNFLIAIVNVPLEGNFYTRRLSGNRIVLTFHQLKDFLLAENIPIENSILRSLYTYTLRYKASNGVIPNTGESTSFMHDETRGCLFDMNGIKSEITESCNKPIICDGCVEKLKEEKVSKETISKVKNELNRIKKDFYFNVLDFVKRKPVISLFISSVYAVLLGAIGSLVASCVYDVFKIYFTP